jgi:hypothetical protein
MDEIWEVSEVRGANSEAPHLWEGLVGAWPLQEGGGSIVWDVSGNRNNGTPQNTSLLGSWKLTPRGCGVLLDGVDDYITVPINHYVTKPFSLVAWCSIITRTTWRSAMGIKINTQPYQTPFYLIVRRDDGNKEYCFEWNGDVNSPGDIVRGTSQFPDGINMLGGMATYERVYVVLNGEIKNSSPRTRAFPTAVSPYYTLIGSSSYDNQDYGQYGAQLHGEIVLAQIYGRPLSASEWAELYADPWAMYRVRPRVLVRGVTLKKTPIHHLMAGCT